MNLAKDNRVLFVLCNSRTGYSLWAKKDEIINNPEFDPYYDKEFLEKTLGTRKRKGNNEDILYTLGNVGGQFLAQNIETPSRVVEDGINLKELERHIEEFQPTHVGFSVMLDSYRTFIQSSRFIRERYPNIKIIAGNVGSLVPGSVKHADFLCRGEGTLFLREILGENIERPIKVPSIVVKRFRPSPHNPKKFIETPTGVLVTNLGCNSGCDFCITYALYKSHYIIGDETGIKQALLEIGEKVDRPNVTVIVADPIGLTNEKKWSTLIDIMRGENYCFHLNVMTTSKLVTKYSQNGGLLDKFKHSEEFEISLFQMGMETTTLEGKYRKNQGAKWRRILKTLNDYGIISVLSAIMGFDHHDHATVKQDLHNIISLDPTILHLTNLRVLYETKLWHHYQNQRRLLDVPPEFRMLWGYQAFLHPHFKPRFQDCLPLMLELEEVIQENIGNYYARATTVIKNRTKSAYNDRLIKIGEAMKSMTLVQEAKTS